MNIFNLFNRQSDNISLANLPILANNGGLSQNAKAVMPNGLTWLFYCLPSIKDKASPPYFNHHTAPKSVLVCFILMVWLILQNKPIGEYVKRFLLQPRVKPHRPMTGHLTQNAKGVFAMNTKPTPTPATGTPPNPLDKSPITADNTATTKLTSAQPSRHTLAIFMPNATGALSIIITSLQDTCFTKAVSAVYGGLIGVNTTPKGNSPSRMLAVVETCHPIYGVVSPTKLTGVFA